MENGVDLDGAPVRPSEEHPPVADPETETKVRSSLYAFDVADTRYGVPVDGGHDAGARRGVGSSQVVLRPSGELDACLSQRFLPSPVARARVGWTPSTW